MVVITAITIISGGPDSIEYAKQSILTSFILNISTMYIILHIKIIKKT